MARTGKPSGTVPPIAGTAGSISARGQKKPGGPASNRGGPRRPSKRPEAPTADDSQPPAVPLPAPKLDAAAASRNASAPAPSTPPVVQPPPAGKRRVNCLAQLMASLDGACMKCAGINATGTGGQLTDVEIAIAVMEYHKKTGGGKRPPDLNNPQVMQALRTSLDM
jgi:hypothetical protein